MFDPHTRVYEFTVTRTVTEIARLAVRADTSYEAKSEAESQVRDGDVVWEKVCDDTVVEEEKRR